MKFKAALVAFTLLFTMNAEAGFGRSSKSSFSSKPRVLFSSPKPAAPAPAPATVQRQSSFGTPSTATKATVVGATAVGATAVAATAAPTQTATQTQPKQGFGASTSPTTPVTKSSLDQAQAKTSTIANATGMQSANRTQAQQAFRQNMASAQKNSFSSRPSADYDRAYSDYYKNGYNGHRVEQYRDASGWHYGYRSGNSYVAVPSPPNTFFETFAATMAGVAVANALTQPHHQTVVQQPAVQYVEQPVAQVAPTQVASQPKQESHGFIFFLLGLLIVVAIASIVWVVFLKNRF